MGQYEAWSAQRLKTAATGVQTGPLRELAHLLERGERAADAFRDEVRRLASAMVEEWKGEAAGAAHGKATESAGNADGTAYHAASAAFVVRLFADGLDADKSVASSMPATDPPSAAEKAALTSVLGPVAAAHEYNEEVSIARAEREALKAKVEEMDSRGAAAAKTLESAFPNALIDSPWDEPVPFLSEEPPEPPDDHGSEGALAGGAGAGVVPGVGASAAVGSGPSGGRVASRAWCPGLGVLPHRQRRLFRADLWESRRQR